MPTVSGVFRMPASEGRGRGEVIVKELLVNKDSVRNGMTVGRGSRLQAIRIRILPRQKQRPSERDLSGRQRHHPMVRSYGIMASSLVCNLRQ